MLDMKVFLELVAKSEKFQQGFQQGERALSSFRTHVSNTMQKVQQLTSNTTMRLNHIQFMGDNTCIIAGGIEFDQSVI